MDIIAICEKAQENDYTKEFGYKYFVRIIRNGIYAGVKTYCRRMEEVKAFANRYGATLQN